ncbi:helix-turn-helix domain-containing protein [Rhodococcus sp. MEB032]|nr:helix-turn-helix domain-containing protein [Rhodococcus sp. MEB032]
MMTVTEVQKVSRRGENWVRGAANSGALKAQPRRMGQWFRFLEDDVNDWIQRGSPQFPPNARKTR